MTSLSQLFLHWKQIRKNLFETANRFTNADLSYTPFGGSRTVVEILCHIGDAEEGWLRYVIYRQHEIHHRGELSLILGMLGREGPDI